MLLFSPHTASSKYIPKHQKEVKHKGYNDNNAKKKKKEEEGRRRRRLEGGGRRGRKRRRRRRKGEEEEEQLTYIQYFADVHFNFTATLKGRCVSIIHF